MVHPEKVTLAPVAWSAQVEDFLSTVETDVSLETARKQAAAGCKLVGVFVEGALSGVFMLALENGEAGKEMSVLWGAGRARDVDLTFTVLPMIEKIAAQFDCKAVFFLTRRQGLIRKAEKIGFSYYETVMKKVI